MNLTEQTQFYSVLSTAVRDNATYIGEQIAEQNSTFFSVIRSLSDRITAESTNQSFFLSELKSAIAMNVSEIFATIDKFRISSENNFTFFIEIIDKTADEIKRNSSFLLEVLNSTFLGVINEVNDTLSNGISEINDTMISKLSGLNESFTNSVAKLSEADRQIRDQIHIVALSAYSNLSDYVDEASKTIETVSATYSDKLLSVENSLLTRVSTAESFLKEDVQKLDSAIKNDKEDVNKKCILN